MFSKKVIIILLVQIICIQFGEIYCLPTESPGAPAEIPEANTSSPSQELVASEGTSVQDSQTESVIPIETSGPSTAQATPSTTPTATITPPAEPPTSAPDISTTTIAPSSVTTITPQTPTQAPETPATVTPLPLNTDSPTSTETPTNAVSTAAPATATSTAAPATPASTAAPTTTPGTATTTPLEPTTTEKPNSGVAISAQVLSIFIATSISIWHCSNNSV